MPDTRQNVGSSTDLSVDAEGEIERLRLDHGVPREARHTATSALLVLGLAAAAAAAQWSFLSGRASAAPPPPSAATATQHQHSRAEGEEGQRGGGRRTGAGSAAAASARRGADAEQAAAEAEHTVEVERLAEELWAASRAAAERRVLPKLAGGAGLGGGPAGLTLVSPPRQAARRAGREVLMEARGVPEALGVRLAPGERLELVETTAGAGGEAVAPSLSLVRVSGTGAESLVEGSPFEAAVAAWMERVWEERRSRGQELHSGRGEDRQAALLAARDEVLLDTWLDKKEDRWEMSPEGLGKAVDMRLVESVAVRQDSRAAVLRLKGDRRAFFVRLESFDWSMFGGLKGLLTERLPSDGVPVRTELMPVRLRELRLQDLALYAQWAADRVRGSPVGAKVIPWYTATLTEVVEEFMLKVAMPLLPKPAKVLLRLDYPASGEGGGGAAASGGAGERVAANLAWLSRAEVRFAARQEEQKFPWFLSFGARTAVVGYPLFLLLPPLILGLFRQLLPRKLPEGELGWRWRVGRDIKRKVKKKVPKDPKKEKAVVKFDDPVKEAFAKMRRIRKPSMRLEDFVGIDPIREEVEEIIAFLRDPRGFTELGAQAPRGVLISGPPGARRDALAQAIAAEAGVPVVNIKGRALLGDPENVGEGATNMRELFAAARDTAPVIIFMQDFDTIGGKRGSSVVATKKLERESALNQLLVELDGFETQDGVLLLAVTENLNLVDPALRRPGRVDRILAVPLPNLVERRAILREAAAASMEPDLVAAVDWDFVADQLPRSPPEKLQQVPQTLQMAAVELRRADMQELRHVEGWIHLYQALIPRWFRRRSLFQRWEASFFAWLGLDVTAADLKAVLPLIDFTQTGMELYRPPYPWTEEFKRPHAIWAAGRGVLAALLPSFDSVHAIYLRQDSYEGVGYTTLRRNRSESSFLTRTYREKQLVLEFGPHMALEMLSPWGERTNLATRDLRRAKQMATRMVMEQGWGLDGSNIIYRVQQQGQALALGSRGTEELEETIEKLYLLAREKAFDILAQNLPALEACIDHLCRHDGMTGKELEHLLQAAGALSEPEPFALVPYSTPPLPKEQQEILEGRTMLAGQSR